MHMPPRAVTRDLFLLLPRVSFSLPAPNPSGDGEESQKKQIFQITTGLDMPPYIGDGTLAK